MNPTVYLLYVAYNIFTHTLPVCNKTGPLTGVLVKYLLPQDGVRRGLLFTIIVDVFLPAGEKERGPQAFIFFKEKYWKKILPQLYVYSLSV